MSELLLNQEPTWVENPLDLEFWSKVKGCKWICLEPCVSNLQSSNLLLDILVLLYSVIFNLKFLWLCFPFDHLVILKSYSVFFFPTEEHLGREEQSFKDFPNIIDEWMISPLTSHVCTLNSQQPLPVEFHFKNMVIQAEYLHMFIPDRRKILLYV